MKIFNRISFLAAFLLFCTAVPLFAHPPSDLRVNYDPAEGVLHIAMTHVTGSNMIRHHIRKIQIFKNDEMVLDSTIVQQTSAHSMTKSIPLSAVAGDTIRVKAICSEGGIGEQTIVVPAADTDQDTPK